MRDTNSLTIVGRLTRDAEMKHSQSGVAVLSFGIAVNRSVKDPMSGEYKDEASFFDVSAFGKSAESVAQYMTKGKQIAIVGELVQDRWEKDGQKQSRVKINANSIQLLSSPSSSPAPAQATTPKPAEAQPSADGFPDDIPF